MELWARSPPDTVRSLQFPNSYTAGSLWTVDSLIYYVVYYERIIFHNFSRWLTNENNEATFFYLFRSINILSEFQFFSLQSCLIWLYLVLIQTKLQRIKTWIRGIYLKWSIVLSSSVFTIARFYHFYEKGILNIKIVYIPGSVISESKLRVFFPSLNCAL